MNEKTVSDCFDEMYVLVTFEEMDCLVDELASSGGSTIKVIDGARYLTDWCYGIEAIKYFIEILKKRHGYLEGKDYGSIPVSSNQASDGNG